MQQSDTVHTDSVLVYTLQDAAYTDYQASSTRVVLTTVLAVIFFRNTWLATRLMYDAARFVYFLNVCQPLIGIMATTVALCHELWPTRVSCAAVIRANNTALLLGVPLITAILFVKAYYCTSWSHWILPIGGLALIGGIASGAASYTALTVQTKSNSYSRCPTTLAEGWVFGKLATDFYANLALSACFMLAVWREYRYRGSPLYSALLRDGIGYALGAIISNILCAIIILLIPAMRTWQMHIYGADCT
ncbi:hypothetical protein THASP1DRAFT_32974 [Thamnocephalis sphaerospora]|uniref:Uncharacterized protein n=1 Tax=Thamnocephalis sphaerospora TaxID=78915 RepID=A0A4P9XHK8_9FUNG|nr:hypothetical protein THASP1DRAFT_32974 [Thamnocephalis sphaerospora]|eukprot:RKP05185.1 hypothetical protein THASP1DRAFT_32974 [Thamnocephalis sphaerospora]